MDNFSGWPINYEAGTNDETWCEGDCIRLAWNGSEGGIQRSILNTVGYLRIFIKYFMYLKSYGTSGQTTSDYCNFDVMFESDGWMRLQTLNIADRGYTYTHNVTIPGANKTSITFRFSTDSMDNGENCYVDNFKVWVYTLEPTAYPTADPTFDPTIDPTTDPTMNPTSDPTIDPTIEPTFHPTMQPTIDPTDNPSQIPTSIPTNDPTIDPTMFPTTDNLKVDQPSSTSDDEDGIAKDQSTTSTTIVAAESIVESKGEWEFDLVTMLMTIIGILILMIIIGIVGFVIYHKKQKKKAIMNTTEFAQQSEKKSELVVIDTANAEGINTMYTTKNGAGSNPANDEEISFSSSSTDGENVDQNGFYVKCIADYVASDQDQLSLKENQVIFVMKELKNGWWYGVDNERNDGWIPSNYVQRLKDEEKQTNDGATFVYGNNYNDTNLDKYLNYSLPPEIVPMIVTDHGTALNKKMQLQRVKSNEGDDMYDAPTTNKISPGMTSGNNSSDSDDNLDVMYDSDNKNVHTKH